MNVTPRVGSADDRRWGEPLLIGAALPGVVAAAALAVLLIAQSWGGLGSLAEPLAVLIVASPALAIVGGVTLVAGAIAAPFVPGRAIRRWGALLLGTLAWGAAFYWLSVPGLVDLP
jgi:hypothetical protein